MDVMSGLEELRENLASHCCDELSFQVTCSESVFEETVMGPGFTAERSTVMSD
jgi:hypothetical protein